MAHTANICTLENLQLQESYEPVGLTNKSREYLHKIINYTHTHGIELFLIVAPYHTTEDHQHIYFDIKEIAQDCAVPFRDFNYEYSDIGIDFSTDMNDDSHLNYQGSCKFTSYLGNIIKETYDIPDHRGETAYESWDRNVNQIEEQAAANR